jgi:cell division protein FtsZ
VGSRWLAPEPALVVEETPAPTPGGGTLFERMSNIARGAAKVDADTEAKDPLDIPRFLNRQNNQ